MINGRWTTTLSSDLSQKRPRARNSATATPIRRLPSSHQKQGGTDILGGGDMVRDARPRPERFERGLAIEPSRHRGGVGHRQPPAAERSREIEAGPDDEFGLVVLRRDQHEPIAEQVDAA